MKKVFLIFAATLMLGLPLRAQQCDTVTTLPWFNDFATDYDCWTTVGSASWMVKFEKYHEREELNNSTPQQWMYFCIRKQEQKVFNK